jgi:hypothetical protein
MVECGKVWILLKRFRSKKIMHFIQSYFILLLIEKKQENMLRVNRPFSIIIFISLFITKHIET